MARRYKYIEYKTQKVLFETTQPNYVSEDAINSMFEKATGRNYLVEYARIDREIRMVPDNKK